MTENNKINNLFAENTNVFGSLTGTENFFEPVTDAIKAEKKQPSKYINDVDSSLILENIDKKASNKAVKINLKISALEKTLKRISEDLALMQLLNLDKDKERIEELQTFKLTLENQIAALKADKKKFGILYYFWGFISGKIDFKAINEYSKLLKNETLKYDKILKDYLKSLNIDMSSLPFKW